LSRLRDHLAPVGALLDEIARAQSFRINDHRFEEDWRALVRRVETLRNALHRLLR